MPDEFDESDIYDSALENEQQPGPEPTGQEVAVPDSRADDLVSSMIRSMQQEQGARVPAIRRQAPPPARSDDPGDHEFRGPGQGERQGQGHQGTQPDPNGLLEALREERRSRQALEQEIRSLRTPKQDSQPQVPFSQRVFEDPEASIDGRVQQHLAPILETVQNRLLDMDMNSARRAYGPETFDPAYQAWFQQVGDPNRPDPQTYWSIMNAASPGEAVVRWYQGQQERAEIGDGGIAGYRERVVRETAEAMGLDPDAAWQQVSGQQRQPQQQQRRTNGHGNGGQPPRASNGQFTPRHEVRLPTATSRMGHTAKNAAYMPEDGSDEAIFDFGRAKPERR